MSYLVQDRSGGFQIVAVDPNFRPHPRNVADTRVEIVADGVALDSCRCERLLHHVGFRRSGRRCQPDDISRILSCHRRLLQIDEPKVNLVSPLKSG